MTRAFNFPIRWVSGHQTRVALPLGGVNRLVKRWPSEGECSSCLCGWVSQKSEPRSPNPLVTEPSTPGEPVFGAGEKVTLLGASRVDIKLAANPTLRMHDDDGALIRCVTVSTYCFKHGRVTIPLKIALAISGFPLAEVGDSSNWEHAKHLRERGPTTYDRIPMWRFENGRKQVLRIGPR
ncbi:hypothetical protein FRC11_010145, partial [Ceratobasidium sp. 423]